MFYREKPDVETKKCEAGDCQAKLAQLERISVTFLRPIIARCGNFVGKICNKYAAACICHN